MQNITFRAKGFLINPIGSTYMIMAIQRCYICTNFPVGMCCKSLQNYCNYGQLDYANNQILIIIVNGLKASNTLSNNKYGDVYQITQNYCLKKEGKLKKRKIDRFGKL
jgi:hypothetical protein